jgi:hypothetical protein
VEGDCDELELIAISGELLPDGSELIFFWKPQLNDLRYVVYQSLFEIPPTAPLFPPGGNVYLKRPGQDTELFIALGDPAPGGFIAHVDLGAPSINNEKASFTATIFDNNALTDDYDAIATKRFDPPTADDKDDECPTGNCRFDQIRVCATEGTDLGSDWTLDHIMDGTSISDGGLLSFGAKIEGWERNYQDHKTAVFTCKHGDLDVIQVEDQAKPIGCEDEGCRGNTFGKLFSIDFFSPISNSDTGVVYIDYTHQPTGIFLSPAPDGDLK